MKVHVYSIGGVAGQLKTGDLTGTRVRAVTLQHRVNVCVANKPHDKPRVSDGCFGAFINCVRLTVLFELLLWRERWPKSQIPYLRVFRYEKIAV